MGHKDYANICQDLWNKSETDNSQNKSQAHISEFTVLCQAAMII